MHIYMPPKGFRAISSLFIFPVLLIYNANAQFQGGLGSGITMESTIISKPLNTNPGINIYKGGINDGSAMGSTITNTPPNTNPGINIYQGSSNDGTTMGATIINTSPNTNPGINIYKGGADDGFAMAASGTTLPVTMISFTGTWQKNDALLIWQTATEINHSHFEVERSIDGIHFTTIGSVSSAGNSSTIQHYQYTDFNIINNLNTSVFYYRLKSVDINGKSVYTAIVILQTGKINQFTYSIYPNPAQQYIVVAGTQDLINKKVTVRLVTLKGQVLQTRQMQNVQERIDLANYAPGVYIIQLIDNHAINFSQKIIKK